MTRRALFRRLKNGYFSHLTGTFERYNGAYALNTVLNSFTTTYVPLSVPKVGVCRHMGFRYAVLGTLTHNGVSHKKRHFSTLCNRTSYPAELGARVGVPVNLTRPPVRMSLSLAC